MPDFITKVVSESVTRLGYRRGTYNNWYKHFPDLIQVVGLQKSRWGGENYLEAGIWLKIFGPDERPKFNECHVRLRLDATFGLEVGNLYNALFDEDMYRMDDTERTEIITAAVKRTECAFFDKVQSIEQLGQFLIKCKKPVVLVDKEARQLFHLGS